MSEVFNLVIGICGVSSSGKSTITEKLTTVLKADKVLKVDDYLIGPIKVFDSNINTYVSNFEDKNCYNLNKFYADLLEAKKDPNNKIILLEGFLLYSREDIASLIDIKFLLDIDKEICYERLKPRNDRNSDRYYFDEYVWKKFKELK
jgi:uridine kinase